MAEIEHFGTTASGRSVDRIELSTPELRVGLISHGARLQHLSYKGSPDLACGSDHLSDFEGELIHNGPIIGPVLNRINGAQATLGGVLFEFDANQDGRITLHSGTAGTQLKVWEIAGTTEYGVTFAVSLPDGEGGFPGNRRIETTYSVDGPMLTLDIVATTDRLTFMAPGFHPYWNLDGGQTWAGHTLQVQSERFLPRTDDYLPTGEIAAVSGTEFDFRKPKQIGFLVDNNFAVNDTGPDLSTVATLSGASGRCLDIRADAPGLQVYSGYMRGIALEPQMWPDATNNPAFPSIELRPEETFRQRSEWIFRELS